MAKNWKGPLRMPSDFSGQVRLFPLPNLVMFPHVIQPLHIFEPRYCDLLQEAMASDQLIAMSVLRPGWELCADVAPPISEYVCIGQVISHTPTEDDRHNILLLGLARAKILAEIDTNRPFRTAVVELVEDVYPVGGANDRMVLQQKLLDSFRHFIPEGALAQESFQQLLGSQVPLGMLTDIIGFSLGIPMPLKEQLLGMNNVDARGRLLLQCLAQLAKSKKVSETGESDSSFPPRFSLN